jgi:hypothetical protein
LALATTRVSLNCIDQFGASLESLAVAVQAMCRIERHIVLPALESCLRAEDRMHLAIEMQEKFDEHVGIVGVEGFPPKTLFRSAMH